MDIPPSDQLLASAVHYLIQGDERDAALVLLSCEATYGDRYPFDEKGNYHFYVHLVGPRAAYEAFNRREEAYNNQFDIVYTISPVGDAIRDAFSAIAPPGSRIDGIELKVQLVDIQPEWRDELLEIAHGRRIHNQGVEIPKREIFEWGNLRFRSQSEVRIAKALDAAGVLFLPNCLARLNSRDGRTTKEADFLVCSNGKWGVLEVDGPYHPRAATDHERDRLFQQHGIRVTQRFTAEDCYNDAPGVARRFLTLLDKNG